jgi:phosphatidate cytidylyltransferase
MMARIISALVMAPIAIAAIWFGSPYFDLMIFVVGLAAMFEWYRLASLEGLRGINLVWLLAGVVYIAVPCVVVIWLRRIDPQGFQFIIWIFVVIWATDIGAYFTGRSLGGAKLAPKISPNKTWAGFFGGIILAIAASLILNDYANPSYGTLELLAASLVLSIVGQLGDLLESWVKRVFGVKDSGSLIPGHGGVLDRIDAILLAAPVAGLIAVFFQIGQIPWK